MTKKKGIIAGIIVAAIAIITFVCIVVFNSPKVVGNYELQAFIQNGEETTEVAELLKSFGGGYTIEFKSDKTGEMTMKAGDRSETWTFTWNGNKVKFDKEDEEDDDEEAIPVESTFEYKDNTITLDLDGRGIKFKRVAE